MSATNPTTRVLRRDIQQSRNFEDKPPEVEWRTIERFEGIRFGDNGNVQSRWWTIKVSGQWKSEFRAEWHDIARVKGKLGYLRVWIRENGRRQRHLVHRLILEAFRGPCPEGMESRHLDDDRSNNHIDNLAWGTRSENTVDQVKSGTHHMIKLTPETAREIREKFQNGRSRAELAREYMLDPSTVWHLIAGNTWKHVE